MAERADVMRSAAYAAMSPSGRKAFHLIEGEVERGDGAAAIPINHFTASGMCRAAARFGTKQCVLLGFASVNVHAGPNRANVFRLIDKWRGVDAIEAKRRVAQAKLPQPPRPSAAKPVKPVKPAPAPKPVEPQRTERRVVVTLPRLSFMDDGR